MERPLYFAIATISLARSHPYFPFTPNISILLLTLGLLLIYFELNRPGSILPGAAGLLLALLAAASIAHLHPSPRPIVLLAAVVLLLLLDLFRPASILVSIAATLALIFGFLHLVPVANVPFPASVNPGTAICCGLALGVGTSLLTRIARRARANKGLD